MLEESKKFPKYVYLIIVFVFLFSIFIRFDKFSSQQNVANLDASYHVLLTTKALTDNPVSIHKLLPILTLGSPSDKGIPWGATVPDEYGNYYYTSFPSMGFIAPYLYFKITNLSLTLKNLMIFNLLIHLVATLLLCRWLHLVLTKINISERLRGAILTIGASSYLLAYESLFSHGIVYWNHSLFQIIWLLQLILLTQLLYASPKKRHIIWLLVVCLIAPLTEWTGYLTNASIAIYFLTKSNYRKISLAVIATTALSGLLFIGQFLLAISPKFLYLSLKSRFLGRSSVSDQQNSFGSLGPQLLHGYWESYSFLLLLPFVLVLAFLIVKFAKRKALLALPPFAGGLLFVLCAPLLENILLLQHAVEYNFDRLKTLIPIIFVVSVLIPLFHAHIRKVILVLWVFAIAGNVWGYYNVERQSIYFNHKETDIQKYIDNDNVLIKLLQQQTEPDALYAITGGVRGWVDFTLNRNVYERVVDLGQLKTIIQQRHATQGVWLLGDDIGNQIYDWKAALIYDLNTDTKQYLTVNGSFGVDEAPFPITDSNWINGIHRSSSSSIVVNANNSQDNYKPGNVVVFSNGEKRTIEKVEVEGSFLKVYVEGNVLDWRLLGFPNKIIIENHP